MTKKRFTTFAVILLVVMSSFGIILFYSYKHLKYKQFVDYQKLTIDQNIPNTDWHLEISQICDFHSSVNLRSQKKTVNLFEIMTPKSINDYSLYYRMINSNEKIYLLTKGGGYYKNLSTCYYFGIYQIKNDSIEKVVSKRIFSCM